MDTLICRLFEQRGLELKRHTQDKKKGPCPSCGGEDRCNVWPDEREGRGYYYCHRCGAQGDAIQFMRDYLGMSYTEACERAGSRPGGNYGLPKMEAPKARRRVEAASRAAVAELCQGPGADADADSPPPGDLQGQDLWRNKATAFAAWAHQQLLAMPAELAWMAKRGLGRSAVLRHGLGFNPGERGRGLVRERTAWGLPPEVRPYNPLRLFTRVRKHMAVPPAERKKSLTIRPSDTKRRLQVFGRVPFRQPEGKPRKLWLPRGLVIPHIVPGPGGKAEVRHLRIRRRDEDRKAFAPDRKYYVIEGSDKDQVLLRCRTIPGKAWPDVVLVVESDLDGLLVYELAGDLVSVLILSTSSIRRLPPEVFARLERAECILVATDFDQPDKEGKRAGLEGWKAWSATFARAKRWMVPDGKDPGEAYERGEDLRLWLMAGIPEGLRMLMTPGPSSPDVPKEDRPAEKKGENSPMRWDGAEAQTDPDEARLPEDCPYSVAYLRRAFAGKTASDGLLVPCPKASTPWWWKYVKSCRTCAGHGHCLLDFVTSPRMLAPLEEVSIRGGEVRVAPESANSPGRPDAIPSDQDNSRPSCGAAGQHVET